MPTTWVRPINGNNANDGLTFATAKQTILAAYDLGVAPDIVYLVAEGDLEVTAQLNWVTGAVGVGARHYIGTNASGVVDGTRFVIRPGTMDPSQELAASTAHLVFMPNAFGSFTNVVFDAGSKFLNAHYFQANAVSWFNCVFQNALGSGLFVNGQRTLCFTEYCRFTGNAANGVDNVRYLNAFHCLFDNNGQRGMYAGNAVVRNCVAYNNGGDGFTSFGASVPSFMTECVSHSNGAFGFNLSANNSGNQLISNCVATSNASHGYRFGGGVLIAGCVAGAGATANTGGVEQQARTVLTPIRTLDVVYQNVAAFDFRITNLSDLSANPMELLLPGGLVSQPGVQTYPIPPGGGTRAYWG